MTRLSTNSLEIYAPLGYSLGRLGFTWYNSWADYAAYVAAGELGSVSGTGCVRVFTLPRSYTYRSRPISQHNPPRLP